MQVQRHVKDKHNSKCSINFSDLTIIHGHVDVLQLKTNCDW